MDHWVIASITVLQGFHCADEFMSLFWKFIFRRIRIQETVWWFVLLFPVEVSFHVYSPRLWLECSLIRSTSMVVVILFMLPHLNLLNPFHPTIGLVVSFISILGWGRMWRLRKLICPYIWCGWHLLYYAMSCFPCYPTLVVLWEIWASLSPVSRVRFVQTMLQARPHIWPYHHNCQISRCKWM